MNFLYTDRFMFSFKFLTFLFVLTISIVDVESTSCLLPNISYTICSSSNTNLVITSKSFSNIEFISECHEDFIEKIFDKSCNDSLVPPTKRKTPTKAESYGYGFLAVFIISGLSVAGLLAVPILNSPSFKYVLSSFTALAVGTLFGDTMFHLIPFELGLHGHSHHDDEHTHSSFSVPDYVWKMLVSVLILYGFYLLELFLHSCVHPKHKHRNLVGHSDIASHHDYKHMNREISELVPMNSNNELEHKHLSNEINTILIKNQIDDINNDSLIFKDLKSNGYTPVSVVITEPKEKKY